MIAKHVPMRSLKKSGFAGLVGYITDGQGKAERLGVVRATNCDAVVLKAVVAEVQATQQANTRAKGDKTYHLVVSFRAGESPTESTLKEIEERICAGIGYAEHQRVSAVHSDTDNLHIHVAINKIHPVKKTMHEPYLAYRTLGELCDVLEDEYGLQKDNHQIYKNRSQSRVADMERHTGIESLASWIKRECLGEIRAAQTWDEFHQVMGGYGLEIVKRANGFVIESTDGTRVKASTVSRDLSKPSLEARLGSFELPESRVRRAAKRRYEKRPVRFRVNTVELYAKYRDEQINLTAIRKVELDDVGWKRDQRIKAARRSNRLRRSAIKLMGDGRVAKKLLYRQAHSALKAEIQSINDGYKKERQRLHEEYKRRTWADWLREQALNGDEKALEALRAREQSKGLLGDTFTGQGKAVPGHAVVDNITKKGTVIYRSRTGVVRDDGSRFQVSRAAGNEVVKEALVMAMQRYGNRITVTGTAQFKAQVIHAAAISHLPITFADASLERRRQQQLEQESSNEQRNEQARRRDERRRADRRRARHTGWRVADSGAGRGGSTAEDKRGRERSGGGGGYAADRNDTRNGSGHVFGKPNVASVGRKPPPFAKNRLRELSSLSLVRLSRGSEVLLPGDVPSELEHERTKPDNQLRWSVSGARGLRQSQVAAVNKYINEREEKRLNGFDISKHERYTGLEQNFAYAGIRNVDGENLALLKRDEKIQVMPIDVATAQRMKRVRLGELVSVTEKGSLKRAKGRSR